MKVKASSLFFCCMGLVALFMIGLGWSDTLRWWDEEERHLNAQNNNQGPQPSPTPSYRPQNVPPSKYYQESFGVKHLPLLPSQLLAIQNDVRLSREYSFKLNTEKLVPRSIGLLEYILIIQRFFDVPLLSPSDHSALKSFDIESVRSQLKDLLDEDVVDDPRVVNIRSAITRNGQASVREEGAIVGAKEECGIKETMRFRRYHIGAKNGTQTIDIKKNYSLKKNPSSSVDPAYASDPLLSSGLSPSDVLRPDFRPNFPSSRVVEKLEQDVHACFTKWSRESRIYEIPISYVPQTCSSLLDLYPFLNIVPRDNLPLDELPIRVEKLANKINWYVLRFKGTAQIIDPETRSEVPYEFEATFTLMYHKITSPQIVWDTEVSSPSAKSEFSFRISSSNGGRGPWPASLVSIVDKRFLDLSVFFDSPELPCP